MTEPGSGAARGAGRAARSRDEGFGDDPRGHPTGAPLSPPDSAPARPASTIDHRIQADAGSRPRVAVLLPYWSFWEGAVAGDLRADRHALLQGAVEAAAAGAEVVDARLVDSRQEGAAAATAAAAAGAEVLVVVQSMAVPPAYAAAALDALAGLPLVVWVAHRDARVDPGLDHGGITTEGATVGGSMLTSSLVRAARPFSLVVGRPGESPVARAIADAVRAAAVAGSLRRARIGRVGRPMDGYGFVDADAGRLREATGVELVPIPPAEVGERFLAVAPERVRELAARTRTRYRVAAEAEPGLDASLRAALALEDLVGAHRLDAGALNCHVPEIRLGGPIGLAPCFGLGRLTSAGVPWTCTGDVLTAVAMLTTKRLGGAAQYHELEAFDEATGELVIASSGEHDLALAAGTPADVIRNAWFPDDPGRGVCARLSPPPGPATLVAFAQLDAPAPAFRLVAARGEFTGSSWPGTGTANGGFRFAAPSAAEGWARWARAGAGHHSSATHGDLADAVALVAAHLGVECVVV